jgi:chromate reductase
MPRTIAVLVGSLREGSFTRKIAKAIEERSPLLKFDYVGIGDLPLYNEDIDKGSPPAEWSRVRNQVKASAGVLFATPEYNRGVPGVLKNAVDVLSRPYGKNSFDGKPAAVVSVSPGAVGGFGANHHLRQSLVFLNTPVLQQPEMYIGNVRNLLDDKGAVSNPDTGKFLETFAAKFSDWVEKFAK